jgi:hypothetical protein
MQRILPPQLPTAVFNKPLLLYCFLVQDDHRTVCDALRKAAAKRLGCSRELPAEAIHLVRKSFDSRRDKR